jgi:hypothetical protein
METAPPTLTADDDGEAGLAGPPLRSADLGDTTEKVRRRVQRDVKPT